MREVWDVLYEELGQFMENVSSLVKSLLAVNYPKDTKSEGLSFMEIVRMLGQVHSDLEELGKTEVLNHKPILLPWGTCCPAMS